MALLDKKILLVGGGHSHALALKYWHDRSVKLPNLTLISESEKAPYSGMLTGCISGAYSEEEIFIDLLPLAQRVGGKFIAAKVKKVDFQKKKVFLDNSQEFLYDLLSINTGGTPNCDKIPGAREFGVGLKPVTNFLREIRSFLSQASSSNVVNLIVVGGGVTGVESILAITGRAQRSGVRLNAHLLEGGKSILAGHNSWVQATARKTLMSHRIKFTEGDPVSLVESRQLRLISGARIDFDFLVLATPVVPGSWVADLNGIRMDGPYITIDDRLMTSIPGVFACGDVARNPDSPVPRAGVYAVRQAAVLAHNLMAYLRGSPLRKYVPQKSILNLMIDGEGRAFGGKGNIFLPKHRLTWLLKDHIDRKFMRQFL